MKITRIESRIHRTSFTYGAGASGVGGNLHLRDMATLLVRVETEDGLRGFGEGFGFNLVETTKDALDRLVAPAAIGQDATAPEALSRFLQRRFHNFGRGGPVLFAISAIDIALWDLAAQRAGKPMQAMLGDAARPRVEAYASLLRYGVPADVARNTRAAVAQGYRRIKLHEVDLACIRAARAAAPDDVPLMLDINCAWGSVAEAIAFCAAVKDLNIAWVEEPIWPPEDAAGIARVRAAGHTPIAAGENVNTAEEFAAFMPGLDVAQPSVTKIGGLTGLRRVADIARAAGVAVVPHSPYFGPGLLATLHWLAACETPQPLEIYFAALADAPYGTALDPVGGSVAVPGPGLMPSW